MEGGNTGKVPRMGTRPPRELAKVERHPSFPSYAPVGRTGSLTLIADGVPYTRGCTELVISTLVHSATAKENSRTDVLLGLMSSSPLSLIWPVFTFYLGALSGCYFQHQKNNSVITAGINTVSKLPVSFLYVAESVDVSLEMAREGACVLEERAPAWLPVMGRWQSLLGMSGTERGRLGEKLHRLGVVMTHVRRQEKRVPARGAMATWPQHEPAFSLVSSLPLIRASGGR